jgi:hypothetical protein
MDMSDSHIMPTENVFLGDVPNSPRSAKESSFFQAVSALGYSYGGTFQAPETLPTSPPKQSLSYITHPGKESPIFV